MANAPAFAAPNPKAFLGNLKLLAKTTDKAQGLKKAFSAVLRGAEAVVETFGGKSPLLTTLGGQPLTHVLGETYYTQVPLLHGPYIAKLSVAPVSAGVAGAGGQEGLGQRQAQWPARRGDRILHHPWRGVGTAGAALHRYRGHADRGCLRRLAGGPSPYVAVARISVPPQPAWSEARSQVVDDRMAFSPWHGLAAHRPIGGIMRARKPAYAMSAEFRGKHNGCPMHEPAPLEPGTLPG